MVMMAARRGLTVGLVTTRAARLVAPRAAGVTGPRATGLVAPRFAMSTIGADTTPRSASKATTTKVAGDLATFNDVMLLQKLSDARWETLRMIEQLKEAQIAHRDAIAESKRMVGMNSQRILLVGASFLVIVSSLVRGRE